MQAFKAIGPQALDSVVVEMTAKKMEIIKWERAALFFPQQSLSHDSVELCRPITTWSRLGIVVSCIPCQASMRQAL